MQKFVLFLLLCAILRAQDKPQSVKIAAIEVEGTHLPTESVIRILNLKVGQTVDDQVLLAACDRVSHTGLIADIDYSFRQASNQDGATVVFKIFDENNLLPATVFPPQNETAVWSCLQGADPIFKKQLPNTQKAIEFYTANIDKCITDTAIRPLHAVAQVICDANQKPSQIQFRIEPGPASQ